MNAKTYVAVIYLGALLLALSGCSAYNKTVLDVGQCFMSEYRPEVTIEVTEKREFGVTLKVYEGGKVVKENAYLLYSEFSGSWEQRDCHK